jgi:hypothetical protein
VPQSLSAQHLAFSMQLPLQALKPFLQLFEQLFPTHAWLPLQSLSSQQVPATQLLPHWR